LIKKRYLSELITQDLARKMVFVGGPRQVGKTSLAVSLTPEASSLNRGYLNWDDVEHRQMILKHQLPMDQELLIFDEVHKYHQWRQLIKGLYDRFHSTHRIMVTGSARLDYYRKGGDSLQGRYHYWRLHPFSVNELDTPDATALLLKFGGFPEPLFSQNETQWRRWQLERQSRLVHGDLRDLERIRELSMMDLLLQTLPERVGSPLSIRSLQEDIGVAHDTVERWITILENIYACYRISPFGPPKIRAVKKEQKLYMWDWSQIHHSEGVRFENMVAGQLLKFCHFKEDREGLRMELRFLRDIDRREVDFVVLQDKEPLFAVECKTGERGISRHIPYFAQRSTIPMFYQVHLGQKDYGQPEHRARVLPFQKFCQVTQMP